MNYRSFAITTSDYTIRAVSNFLRNVDTGGKFSAGNVDTCGKFAAGIKNASKNGGKICHRCR